MGSDIHACAKRHVAICGTLDANTATDMPTTRELHTDAMKHAQEAAVLLARNEIEYMSRDDFDTVVAEYHRAWELECQAIDAVMAYMPDNAEGRQPTERILRRSAVALLHSALSAMDKYYSMPEPAETEDN